MTQSTEVLASPSPRIGRSRRRLSPSTREAAWGYIFIGPWLIGLLLFTAGPMIASMVLSFTDFDLLHPDSWKFVGLDNYIRMTTDPNVATSVRVTFEFAAHHRAADDARQPRLRGPAQQPAAVRSEHPADAGLHAHPDPARRGHPRLDRLPQPGDRLDERASSPSSGSTRDRTGSTARPGSTRRCRSSACGGSATSCSSTSPASSRSRPRCTRPRGSTAPGRGRSSAGSRSR